MNILFSKKPFREPYVIDPKARVVGKLRMMSDF